MLKSGASFRPTRIEKVEKLFKPSTIVVASKSNKAFKQTSMDDAVDEDEKILDQLDSLMLANKEASLQAQN